MKWVIRNDGTTGEVDVTRSGDRFVIIKGEQRHEVELVRLDGAVASLRFLDTGTSYQITYQQEAKRHWRVAVRQREFSFAVLTPTEAIEVVSGGGDSGPSRVMAPIPGKVVAIKVAEGDEVAAGQSLIVLEAMKMENELSAEQAGRVTAVHVNDGQTVDGGELLVEIE
jgi:biotin carboxyl carrier protein